MDIPKTAQDLFDDLLPAGLLAQPARARELDTIFCFRIVGGGDWTIDCSCDVAVPSCTSGVAEGAHVTIEIEVADFQSMLADPDVGMQLYYKKRLRIGGDPARALKIASLFELARPQR